MSELFDLIEARLIPAPSYVDLGTFEYFADACGVFAGTRGCVHAADDKAVNVANSVRFFETLHAQNIPTEMHIYPRDGHGFGINNPTTQDRWIDRCKAWLVS